MARITRTFTLPEQWCKAVKLNPSGTPGKNMEEILMEGMVATMCEYMLSPEYMHWTNERLKVDIDAHLAKNATRTDITLEGGLVRFMKMYGEKYHMSGNQTLMLFYERGSYYSSRYDVMKPHLDDLTRVCEFGGAGSGIVS